MEFFEYLKNDNISSEYLQQHITVENISKYCASVDAVLEHNGAQGVVYCVWGEFNITRECISGGVRFSLPGCINNIIWSITTGHEPNTDQVVMYISMNREQQDEYFVETLKTFVEDLKHGLNQI